jgi:predicted short-subunit dehydrogenase-like oxidoreductase (DUF2520 family)
MEVTIVGAGRLGTALAKALKAKHVNVTGPLGKGDPIHGKIVLLAVPDREIGNVGKLVPRESVVGHAAGAVTLGVFGKREAFSMHPLMTAGSGEADFSGASAAIAGTTAHARHVARDLATKLGMHPIEVADEERVAYHAAASIAANFLITLETMAERIGERAGVNRRHLMPLAKAALENWAAVGPVAITGPIARGDDETVARHRAEIRKHAPEFYAAWEAMAKATRHVVHSHHGAPRGETATKAKKAARKGKTAAKTRPRK